MSTNTGPRDREETLAVLKRIAGPVLRAAGRGRLHVELPQRAWEAQKSDLHTSPLQAFGRTVSGLAPWLNLPLDGDDPETTLRRELLEQTQAGLAHALDPDGPDFAFGQPTPERIVHGCYLAYPLAVARGRLWDPLSPESRDRCVEYLQTYRRFPCNESNWLLFPAITECALWELTGDCDPQPIEYAVKRHLEFYVGDGTYGDGPEYHWDFYNSYVIHPFLLEVLRTCRDQGHPCGEHFDRALARAQRYAEVLERMVSPEGTFPILGRSSVYRIAVFYHLSYLAWRGWLPESLRPGVVRSALTAVIRRVMNAPGTFDEHGWLQPGAVGHQPGVIDSYTYTGALYFCMMGLTHLGLPAGEPFWTEPGGPWTQQRLWSGQPEGPDRCYKEA
ncbi:MAG: DUF2264 domain-containing protein [Planctomycetota bacterium]